MNSRRKCGLIIIVLILIQILFLVSIADDSTDVEENINITINTKTILNKISSEWKWGFTTNINVSFIHPCPGIITKSSMNVNNITIAYYQNDIIYSKEKNILYTVAIENRFIPTTGDIACISFYNTNKSLISYVKCAYMYNLEYFFLNSSGQLIAYALLNNNSWIITPLQEIDLRLYGLFLTYTSFVDDYSGIYLSNSDDCNISFIFIFIFDIILVIIFVTLYVIYKLNTYKKKSISITNYADYQALLQY